LSLATIAGREVHVDDEGFMTEYEEWTEELAEQFAPTSESSSPIDIGR
jgi:sulfur relay (sulfurtransferase) DsrC/TusE family protein